MVPSSDSARRDYCIVLSHAVVSALLRELTVLRLGMVIAIFVT